MTASAIIVGGDGTDVVPAEQGGDVEFEREKEAFMAISPFALGRYRGRFVASQGGRIVDFDADLSVLVNRFFMQHPDAPVYITRVGPDEDEFRIDTPFFE
jgi:hypothetical protein